MALDSRLTNDNSYRRRLADISK